MVGVAMVAVIVVVAAVVKVLVWAAAITDLVMAVEGLVIDVSNAFAVTMTALEFPVSTPLEECSR